MTRYLEAARSAMLAAASTGSLTVAWKSIEPLLQGMALLVSILSGLAAIWLVVKTVTLRNREIHAKDLENQERETRIREHRAEVCRLCEEVPERCPMTGTAEPLPDCQRWQQQMSARKRGASKELDHGRE